MKSLILLLFSLLFVNAQAQVYQTENGKAVFYSQVPLHEFSGTSQHLHGRIDLNENTVDFYLDLETLETGIGKRDRDMRQTLQTNAHPFAEFFGKLISEFDPALPQAQNVIAAGVFTIHGIEREIEVEGSLQATENGLMLKANWILRLEDYEITPPKLLFIKVDQEQKIEIEALLIPAENE